MFEDLLKQVDGLIKDSIKQYRDQFKVEADTFCSTLKKEYGQIRSKLEEEMVQNEKEARERLGTELQKKTDAINARITELSTKQIDFEKTILNEIKEIHEKISIEIQRVLDLMKPTVKNYLEENPKEVRRVRRRL